MSVLKMVNRQYPDVKIDYLVETDMTVIHDIVGGMDVALTKVTKADKSQYDYFTDHIIYPCLHLGEDKDHLIHGMIKNFNKRTGLNLKYESEILAQFKEIPKTTKLDKPHIVMPACGKSLSEGGKEWGFDNFNGLADRLSEHYYIVQVGSNEPFLDAANERHYNEPFPVVLALMKQADFFIGMVNGLAHLAGHHGINTYCIYCGGNEHPGFTGYPNQIPIIGDKISVETVYNQIRNNEKRSS